MKLNEIKNASGVQTVRCQLLITEDITTKGDNYLKLEFSDRTKIYINVWNNNSRYSEYRNMGINKIHFVEAKLEYRGLNSTGYDEYNLYDITKVAMPSLVDCVDIQGLISELRVICAGIKNDSLRELVFAMCRYKNKEVLNKLFECPVTEKSAYSFKGGTLAHIVRTCKLCDAVAGVYNVWNFNDGGFNERVNVDLLKTIAIFHDLGKAEKYFFENDQIKKTFKGEMLSDSEISIGLLHNIINSMQKPPLPDEVIIIEHAIAASKGRTDMGAILDPRTKEAELFASIERIECTMGNFEYMKRVNIGDDFQKVLGKQYYTSDYEDISINDALKALL